MKLKHIRKAETQQNLFKQKKDKGEDPGQMTLFDFLDEGKEEEKVTPCLGCEKNNIFLHNGIYCRIYDWTNLNKSIPFIDVFKEGNNYGEI